MNMTRTEVDRILARQSAGAVVIPPIHAIRKGRGVVRTPGMPNKTEAAYGLYLEALKASGAVLWYAFEGITFKLAHDCRYTPDYAVMLADMTLEAHEVKGHMEDDARVKIKVAARMFPIVFRLVRAKSRKHGGGYDIEEVKT